MYRRFVAKDGRGEAVVELHSESKSIGGEQMGNR
jgi:hypothetical protein